MINYEYLNNYMYNPTTEYTLVWLWNQLSTKLKGLESITFAEGSKTNATLTKKDMLELVLNGGAEVDWIPEEFRGELVSEVNLEEDEPNVLEDTFSITTNTKGMNDFTWFYDYVMWCNTPEIKEEINAIRKKYGKEPLQ